MCVKVACVNFNDKRRYDDCVCLGNDDDDQVDCNGISFESDVMTI